ncbi:Long-chain fatty acid transport protein precursor [Vibrio aerogenes CECT 7868]|uniref:Long-chain fatty acid transport protein n=1 Tax=Vibrio aerogenes CECT 7868 TaxID=1216006 RepID=A0A1M5Z954_9VIBR|nr:outer membrane protein transport protein [Vibrio aerogenes]SHI20712.1 Long-chain fatty acid transport protein precursor [Vibrio aerogenes CECT 7868]
MNKPCKFYKKALLAAAVTLTAQQATAAGFQVNAQSATGLGRAYAGDAVIADNASVLAKNPAAMTLFDSVSLSFGVETITTLIDVKDGQYCGLGCQLGASSAADASYDDAGDTSVAPNFYLIVPVNDQFAWGVSAYSNFGTKTEFSSSYQGSEYGGTTDVKSFNLGLSGAYRLNDQWSLGAGLDLIYGQGKLKRSFSSGIAAVAGTSTALDVDADGWAAGFNLGAVYELDKDNRFGIDYHYSPEIKTKGDISFAGYPQASGSITDHLPLQLPDFAEFSGYHRLNEDFAVHYSIQWLKWSEFSQLEADTSGVLKKYNWQDGWHYSVGGTYFMDKTWTLRAGYMFDTSVQDATRSISVPDSDRHWFSAGVSYHLDEQSTVDFGMTYLLGRDVDVTETTSMSGMTLSVLNGTTHADAIMLAIQYSHSF